MEINNFEAGMKKISILSQAPLDQDTVTVYHDVLKELTDEQWAQVVNAYGKKVTQVGKLPATGYLLSLSRPSAKTQAAEVWDYILKQRRKSQNTSDYDPEIGSIYNLPDAISENQMFYKIIRIMGGWQDFCSRRLTEWDWKTFKDAYEAYSNDPVFSAQALKSYSQATLEFQERKALTEGE